MVLKHDSLIPSLHVNRLRKGNQFPHLFSHPDADAESAAPAARPIDALALSLCCNREAACLPHDTIPADRPSDPKRLLPSRSLCQTPLFLFDCLLPSIWRHFLRSSATTVTSRKRSSSDNYMHICSTHMHAYTEIIGELLSLTSSQTRITISFPFLSHLITSCLSLFS